MPAVRDPLLRLRAAAAARDTAGLRRVLAPRDCGPAGVIDLASNDYLGLSQDPEVVEGAVAAARQWGAGSTGSRLVSGDTRLHARLEQALAEFSGSSAALVFSSGYLANLAVITSLAAALDPGAGPPAGCDASSPAGRDAETSAGPAAGSRAGSRAGRPPPGVLVVSDEANHASLIDACRLARARVEIVPHRDVAAVERALAGRTEPAALVVTESVFSVLGDLAPVGALQRAARAHGAMLVIDEAHAFGVVGSGGRGAAWAAGIAAEPDVVRTVTLSKAMAAQGGAVLGAVEVVETLTDTGRSFIFDTGLAPPCAGAALAALGVLRAREDLARRARVNARRLAELAGQLGLAASEPAAAVVSILLGEPELAVTARRLLASHGVRAGCFRSPSVPPGRSCLRLTARASLSEEDFAAVQRALGAVRDHVRNAAFAGRK